MGTVCWKRKVGRCPNGCKIGDIVPGDDLLGLEKNKKFVENYKSLLVHWQYLFLIRQHQH